MEHIIETKDLYKSYSVGGREVPILNGITLHVKNGESVAIMGPSGCGKSSLLYLLGGLDVPTAGTVYFNQHDLNKMNDHKKSIIRRKDMGFVFQFYNLVQNLTVEENIVLPIIMDGRKKNSVQRKLDDLLDIVGLSHRRTFTPRELSGGQQQRVAIARALIANPKLILADEPIGNLDSESGTGIMELFRTIHKEQGVTIVQVTHSKQAASYSERIIYMKDGIIKHDPQHGRMTIDQ